MSKRLTRGAPPNTLLIPGSPLSKPARAERQKHVLSKHKELSSHGTSNVIHILFYTPAGFQFSNSYFSFGFQKGLESKTSEKTCLASKEKPGPETPYLCQTIQSA